MAQYQGRLMLVVGSSGVGKDSVLDGARAYFSKNPSIVFQRRVITRAAMAGAEDHDAMSVDAFKEARARGAFALSWQAHGLWYGVPVEIESSMQAGCTVIVNTSRTIIDAARMAYAGTQVIVITASPEILKKRLAGRGRETAMEIESRLARIVDVPVVGQDIWTVENDNTLNDAIDRFVDIVKRVSELR